MSSHPPEPLSTEERELAQRLARVGSPGEPSPVLDARILAAAHDAVAKRSPLQSRRRHRLPVAFGIAASLALAVGIAWQLRPLPQAPPAYDETTAAMIEIAAADSVQPGAPADNAAKALSTAPSKPMPSARPLSPAANAEEMQANVSSNRGNASASASAAYEPPIVFDSPQPVDVQAPQPAPPAPPPPAAAVSTSPEFVPTPSAPATVPPQRDRSESAARAASTQQRSLSGGASPARNAEAKDASTLDTITATDGSEEGFDERPPTTADSPEVQQAWLQRIRELITGGESDAARGSLQEFKRRHPGTVLPDDLRRFDRQP